MATLRQVTRMIVLLVGVSMIAACSRTPSGGISSENAKVEIESSTGLQVKYIDLHRFRDGFTETRNVFISMNVDNRHQKIPPAVLVDYLAKMAWAVHDLHPNLFIGIVFEPANDDSPNWLEAARSAGLDPEESPEPNYVTLTVESATKAFGPWPGPVPELPSQRDDQKTK